MSEDSEQPVASFWSQLQQRKVFRVAVAYAVVAFVVIQIADATFEALQLPPNAIPWLLAVMFFAFPFVLTVAWLYETTPAGVVRDSRFAELNRPIEIAFITAVYGLAFVLATFFGWLGWSSDKETGVVARTKPTIAVLPFQDYSLEGNAAFLGYGIAEQLLTVLDRFAAFEVVGRTSSFLYGARELDIAEIGASLGADHIVEGSVTLDPPRVLVTVQLIESSSSLHVWSRSYERNLENLIDLELEIANEIADSMNIVLTRNEGQSDASPTLDAQAYLYYLRGKEYLRRPASEQTLTFARGLFGQALAEDPNMLSAEVGICQSELGLFRVTRKPEYRRSALATCVKVASNNEQTVDSYIALGDLHRLLRSFDEAATAFEKALALDQKSARAMHGLARAYLGLGRVADAERAFLRAIELDPSWAYTHRGYGFFLAQTNRMPEAAEEFRRAVQLAPDDINALINLGVAYFEIGEWLEARTAYSQALELNRTGSVLGNFATLLYYEGDFAGASAMLEEALEIEGPDYWQYGKLGAALRELGEDTAARDAFQRAAALARERLASQDDALLLATLAGYEANLGEFETARKLLERAEAKDPELADVPYFAAVVTELAGNGSPAPHVADALALGYPQQLLEADPLLGRFVKTSED